MRTIVFTWLFAWLLGCCWTTPLDAATVSVAMVELRNLTDERLPRIGSYTENAFYKHFYRDSRLEVVGRTEVSALLIERRDRVVLFPGNSELTASFARDLGVDYLLTGNILEYSIEGDRHHMAIELVAIGATERKRVFRKLYSGTYRDGSGYKKHREILDEIIETLSLDLAVVLQDAKQRRDEEALARQRAAMSSTRERLERSKNRTVTTTDSMQNSIRAALKQNHNRQVKVEFLEIELRENNWGGSLDGEAEFEFVALLPRPDGNADSYSFPPEGQILLGPGERLTPEDGGFVVSLPRNARDAEISFIGFDSDELSPGTDLLVNTMMSALSTGVGALAKAHGMLKAGASFLSFLVDMGGGALKTHLEKRDTIGQGRIALDGSIPKAPNGAVRSVTSTNGAMTIQYRVSAF